MRAKNISNMTITSIPANMPVTGVSARLRVEWPTWALVVAVYGGWVALTYWCNALPWWFCPAGRRLAHCFGEMSLQHEIIHGHPTRNTWINTALGFPPLELVAPFVSAIGNSTWHITATIS